MEYENIFSENIAETAPAGCSAVGGGDWKKYYAELLKIYDSEKEAL